LNELFWGSLVSIGALLLVVGHGDGTSSGEGPARSAISLVEDSGNDATGNPVD
jgi:hypothetical protein